VVFALHLLHDDLAGQYAIALLLQIEGHVEVAEVLLVEGVFADAEVEGAAIALVTLQQGLTQGGLHHLGSQLLLVADVVDQVVQAGQQDKRHGGFGCGDSVVRGRGASGGSLWRFRDRRWGW